MTPPCLIRCEIDTVCYAGLPRRMRERMKEAGRVAPTDEQADLMVWSKIVHIVAIVVVVLLVITTNAASTPIMIFGVQIAFIIGGVFEEIKAPAAPVTVACGVAKTIFSGVMATVLWFAFVVITA